MFRLPYQPYYRLYTCKQDVYKFESYQDQLLSISDTYKSLFDIPFGWYTVSQVKIIPVHNQEMYELPLQLF